MTMSKDLFAGVEAGGTTWIVAIAEGCPTNIIDRVEFDTTTPNETIQKAIDFLKSSKHSDFKTIGIAAFGPLDLNPSSETYGFITNTPKLHWKNTNLLGPFKAEFGDEIAITIETDVNAPAVYEQQNFNLLAKQQNIDSACYITIGTGIGVGVCIDGKPRHGFMHPEAGHSRVPLCEADIKNGFKGTCPFHGSCVEGMASAGAIAARLAGNFDRTKLQSLPDDDIVWDTMAHYVAMLCVNLTLTVSPHLIVIGGGLSKRSVIFPKIRTMFKEYLGGYVPTPELEDYIRPSSLSAEVGLTSSLFLAQKLLLEN